MIRLSINRALLAAGLVTAALVAGCGHRRAPFKWVDDLPATEPKAGDGSYVIAVGDLVSIRVWREEAMTARSRVRADGRISLPLLNDVVAAGWSPPQLASQLQTRLKDFFNNPVVTVTLEEQRPLTISVVGEVTHAGTFTLDPGSGVLQALAAAGGPNDLADREMIFVLRNSGSGQERIRMTFEALLHLKGRAAQFKLQTGDVVAVE